ncbi:MAG: hypothetical protein E3J72_04035 [Planctomycetota bacterium]|nr:MAG: hypothetical protein E3J72_04035 [Planctomycetota bacterium]
MKYLEWYGWLLFFALLISATFWIYKAVRVTFMLIRGVRSEKEDNIYNRRSLVLIYLITNSLLFTWLGIIITEIFYGLYGRRVNSFADISIFFPLIGSIVGVYGSLLGLIYFPRKRMKAVALATHLTCIGGILQAGFFVLMWY